MSREKEERKKVHEFKHEFTIPTEEFKETKKAELTIHQFLLTRGRNAWMEFEVTIPKYIYEKVVDTEERYQVTRPEDDFARDKDWLGRDKFVRFKNILKAMNFNDLVTEMEKLVNDSIQVQLVEDSKQEKVICVKYTSSRHSQLDNWNHASMGYETTIKFQWFVCYRRHLTNFPGPRIVYEGLEQNTHGLQDQYKGYGFKAIRQQLDQTFKIITWTKEREEFFENIENGFNGLRDKLDDFLKNLTDDRVSELMTKYKSGYFLPEYKKEESKDGNRKVET